ncbi:MAG: DUF898 family protein [Hyphomicrobiaceae bacterium]|nr:DUF898 family protein [Hyphomicrobiaceae bacterium]
MLAEKLVTVPAAPVHIIPGFAQHAGSASVDPNSGQSHQSPFVTFVEPEESFLALSIRNFGLTLATLGFYSFWARAEARQQLHRAIRIDGKPLDFTGTGREGFISFLIGIVVTICVTGLVLVLLVQNSHAAANPLASFAAVRWQRLAISLPLVFLLGSVVYRKRKHNLRRTWCGKQNFDLVGHPWHYAFQHFWTAFLVPATLGWAAPWRASRLERRKIDEMRFGDTKFHAVGTVKPLYKAFAVLWFGGGTAYVGTMALLGVLIGPELLSSIASGSLKPLQDAGSMGKLLLILGIGMTPVIAFLLFYRAAWIEHQVSSVGIGDMRLDLKLPKWRFAGLMVTNALIKIVSFGGFQPAADAQLVRFVVNNIRTVPLDPQPAVV